MSLTTIREYGFSGFTGFSHLIVFDGRKYHKLKLCKVISQMDLMNLLDMKVRNSP